eukprot:evm.model.scf_971.1 EVM.evm.TU.scf_971.1   scf_971:4322-11769(-)
MSRSAGGDDSTPPERIEPEAGVPGAIVRCSTRHMVEFIRAGVVGLAKGDELATALMSNGAGQGEHRPAIFLYVDDKEEKKLFGVFVVKGMANGAAGADWYRPEWSGDFPTQLHVERRGKLPPPLIEAIFQAVVGGSYPRQHEPSCRLTKAQVEELCAAYNCEKPSSTQIPAELEVNGAPPSPPMTPTRGQPAASSVPHGTRVLHNRLANGESAPVPDDQSHALVRRNPKSGWVQNSPRPGGGYWCWIQDDGQGPGAVPSPSWGQEDFQPMVQGYRDDFRGQGNWQGCPPPSTSLESFDGDTPPESEQGGPSHSGRTQADGQDPPTHGGGPMVPGRGGQGGRAVRSGGPPQGHGGHWVGGYRQGGMHGWPPDYGQGPSDFGPGCRGYGPGPGLWGYGGRFSHYGPGRSHSPHWQQNRWLGFNQGGRGRGFGGSRRLYGYDGDGCWRNALGNPYGGNFNGPHGDFYDWRDENQYHQYGPYQQSGLYDEGQYGGTWYGQYEVDEQQLMQMPPGSEYQSYGEEWHPRGQTNHVGFQKHGTARQQDGRRGDSNYGQLQNGHWQEDKDRRWEGPHDGWNGEGNGWYQAENQGVHDLFENQDCGAPELQEGSTEPSTKESIGGEAMAKDGWRNAAPKAPPVPDIFAECDQWLDSRGELPQPEGQGGEDDLGRRTPEDGQAGGADASSSDGCRGKSGGQPDVGQSLPPGIDCSKVATQEEEGGQPDVGQPLPPGIDCSKVATQEEGHDSGPASTGPQHGEDDLDIPRTGCTSCAVLQQKVKELETEIEHGRRREADLKKEVENWRMREADLENTVKILNTALSKDVVPIDPPEGPEFEEPVVEEMPHTVVVLDDAEDLYLIGGMDGENLVKNVNIFHQERCTWQEGPDLAEMFLHGAAAVLDHSIFLIGGTLVSGDQTALPSSQLWQLDTVIGTSCRRAPLPQPLSWLGAATLGSKILAVGGIGPTSSEPSAAVHEYIPDRDDWIKGPDLNVGRAHLGVAAADGIIYAIGGFNQKVLSSIEMLDAREGRWSEVGVTLAPRSALACASYGGKLAILGGYNSVQTLNTAETFDPRARTNKLGMQEMQQARCSFSATVVDNVVYAIGGNTATQPRDGAEYGDMECFDIREESWNARLPAGTTKVRAFHASCAVRRAR